jgi:hypothetical protein
VNACPARAPGPANPSLVTSAVAAGAPVIPDYRRQWAARARVCVYLGDEKNKKKNKILQTPHDDDL